MASSPSADVETESSQSTTTGRVVVISPHLDDAALSLGATIAYASHCGVPVTVLTVFAGDPNSNAPAGTWDKFCGFTSAGDAARARRDEDERACEIIGASPAWLPFANSDYPHINSGDEIWEAVRPHLRNAALALVPGHPLWHPDHAWLADLIARRASAVTKIGLYVEQPYANLAAIGRGYTPKSVLAAAAIALRTPRGRALQRPTRDEPIAALFDEPLEWHAARAESRQRRAKIESIEAYSSQLSGLGRRLLPRIRLYEWGWGGEGIGLPGTVSADQRGRVRVWDACAALICRSRTVMSDSPDRGDLLSGV
jgi:LmbE family N-acetylglucosaminyl deacetylase